MDDGSHDILQEVLAIEREKDEERMRMNSERDKGVPKLSKRKKSETLDDEYDDILALATPAKKERSSPPTPKSTPAPAEKPGPSMSITIPKAQPPKISKKERLSEQRPSSVPPPPIDVPLKPSHKGKEKEVVPPPSSRASPCVAPPKVKKPPVVYATPINEKKCRELLKVLQKIPEAAIFLRPVDPVVDGCPT